MMNGNGIINGITKYRTICKFCRKPVIEAPPLDIPVMGDAGKPARELLTALTKHMMKAHKEEFAAGAALVDDVLAFLVLNAFEHQDPSIPARLERIRAGIFAQVRKNSFADSMLDHVVAGFGLEPDQASHVTEALRAVRDACCEFGPYAPNASPAEQSRLVTP